MWWERISRLPSLAARLQQALVMSFVVALSGRMGVGEKRGRTGEHSMTSQSGGGGGGCGPCLLFLPAVEIKCHQLLSTKRLILKCQRNSTNIPPLPGPTLDFQRCSKELTVRWLPQYGLPSGRWSHDTSSTLTFTEAQGATISPETPRGI